MAGQNFVITRGFASGSNQSYQGSVTVTPPAAGNNPQNIDQVVSAANAALTPGHAAGDQRIAGAGGGSTFFATSDIGYAASPLNTNGGGYGFVAKLVSAGSGSGAQQIVIKFIAYASGTYTVVKSYTLVPNQSVAVDAIGASADLGNVNITEIDATPSPDGSVFEVFGILNLNV